MLQASQNVFTHLEIEPYREGLFDIPDLIQKFKDNGHQVFDYTELHKRRHHIFITPPIDEMKIIRTKEKITWEP